MKNLSDHIMDIAQNSIRAKATSIKISILENDNILKLIIEDNGSGMDKNTLQKLNDAFFTTRTTRKVGLGIPLLKQSAEQAGGELLIKSKTGKGTKVIAYFDKNNIDCLPVGDIELTIALLICANPELNIHFLYQKQTKKFEISTNELIEAAGDIPISSPKITNFLKELIKENLQDLKVDFN